MVFKNYSNIVFLKNNLDLLNNMTVSLEKFYFNALNFLQDWELDEENIEFTVHDSCTSAIILARDRLSFGFLRLFIIIGVNITLFLVLNLLAFWAKSSGVSIISLYWYANLVKYASWDLFTFNGFNMVCLTGVSLLEKSVIGRGFKDKGDGFLEWFRLWWTCFTMLF